MKDNKPVLLTLHEALRLDLIEAYVAREITLAEVAESMELTRRQCSRLIKRYREHGPLSLVNRRRGQLGNRQLMPGLAERALLIIRERYADFGPTLACEKLAELHGAVSVQRNGTQADDTGWLIHGIQSREGWP
ncbi:helix-turn-helix domain-containing protein [Escherichia marmotae]|uniref:helix-turn-helix domain-containing protein n=1 Tax=Escherichia marmotae TaxID=1499973 RepID=UPI00164F0609|nr:helix-turn-helix domain-containing protein [Escherichia marmotae]